MIKLPIKLFLKSHLMVDGFPHEILRFDTEIPMNKNPHENHHFHHNVPKSIQIYPFFHQSHWFSKVPKSIQIHFNYVYNVLHFVRIPPLCHGFMPFFSMFFHQNPMKSINFSKKIHQFWSMKIHYFNSFPKFYPSKSECSNFSPIFHGFSIVFMVNEIIFH